MGCTDTNANNYNPEATEDDGSCLYDVYGCMDSLAINYYPDSTIDGVGDDVIVLPGHYYK